MNIEKHLAVMWNRSSLYFFRRRLAHINALPQLVILGVGAGAFTGLVTVVFRAITEFVATIIMERDSENFEALPLPLQVAIPILGALTIGHSGFVRVWPEPLPRVLRLVRSADTWEISYRPTHLPKAFMSCSE